MFLSGCSANHYSIHRSDHLDSDESVVIAVDAKQRFLLSNVISKTGEATPGTSMTPEKFRRYCAEPSPDVFSVLSQAASGSGSFGQTADPKSINIALQAAFSSSETGATISRTQTINMLKEMMYRTCERYLNGQISDFEYPIIAARDQRIMTSILAIEQLTGAVLPKPVVIAATGSASTGQLTNDAILSLDNANKKLGEKKNAFETAQKEFIEIDKPEGSCETLLAKKEDEVTTEGDKVKLKKCNEKKGNIEKAEKELKEAKVHYDAIASLAGKPGVSSTTTSSILLSSSPTTEIDKQIEQVRSQTIQDLAEVVENIVSMSFKQEDETSFFCYRVLDKKGGKVLSEDKNSDKGLSDACIDYLLAKVQNESARLNLEAVETTSIIDEFKSESFDNFWKKIKNKSDQVDNAKLEKIINRILSAKPSKPLQVNLNKMKTKKTKEEIRNIFNVLQSWVIDELLKD
jgi:hypothetical protein